MKFSDLVSGYEGFARRLAARAAERVDALLAPRRIRTEASEFVLGAEAIPAPVRYRQTFRR